MFYSAAVASPAIATASFALSDKIDVLTSHKRVGTTDYIFDLTTIRAPGYRPARLATLGFGFVFSTSLQNLRDMAIANVHTGEVHLLGPVPFGQLKNGSDYVWPRILDLATLAVDFVETAAGRRPARATMLMSFSVFDGSSDRRCQKVLVKTFEADLTGAGKHRFTDDWFESPCVPERLGSNHSWESGGGITIIPPELRENADRIEFILALGHFLAVKPSDWMDSLPNGERDKITGILKISQHGQSEVIARGFRNAQGITFVQFGPGKKNVKLLATDQGPYSGDEINVIEEGQFYGWPHSSFGRRYNPQDAYGFELEGLHQSGRRPIFYFADASLAVSPILFVSDSIFDGRWSGLQSLGICNILVGAMAKGSLYRLVFDGEKVLTSEEISIGFRTRSIAEMEGSIIVGSDDDVLGILNPVEIRRDGEFQPMKSRPTILSERSAGPVEDVALGKIEPALSTADTANGKLVFNRCTACHSLEKGNHLTGPSLFGVLGRKPSDVTNYSYSSALRHMNPTWTISMMDRFIEDTRSFVPGTTMGFVGIKDAKDRADLIAYLIKETGAAP